MRADRARAPSGLHPATSALCALPHLPANKVGQGRISQTGRRCPPERPHLPLWDTVVPAATSESCHAATVVLWSLSSARIYLASGTPPTKGTPLRLFAGQPGSCILGESKSPPRQHARDRGSPLPSDPTKCLRRKRGAPSRGLPAPHPGRSDGSQQSPALGACRCSDEIVLRGTRRMSGSRKWP